METKNISKKRKFPIEPKWFVYVLIAILFYVTLFELFITTPIDRDYEKFSDALGPLAKEFYLFKLDENEIYKRFAKYKDMDGKPFITKIVTLKDKPNIKRLLVYSKGLNGIDDYDYEFYDNEPCSGRSIDDYGLVFYFEKDDLTGKFKPAGKNLFYPKNKEK